MTFLLLLNGRIAVIQEASIILKGGIACIKAGVE
jgi:hypothetical protein